MVNCAQYAQTRTFLQNFVGQTNREFNKDGEMFERRRINVLQIWQQICEFIVRCAQCFNSSSENLYSLPALVAKLLSKISEHTSTRFPKDSIFNVEKGPQLDIFWKSRTQVEKL